MDKQTMGGCWYFSNDSEINIFAHCRNLMAVLNCG